jgi:hypothetical protein
VARERHPAFEFHVGDWRRMQLNERFDDVVLASYLNWLPDLQDVFGSLHKLTHARSRVVLCMLNPLWRMGMTLREKLKYRKRLTGLSWLSRRDIAHLLHLTGWEMVQTEGVHRPWRNLFARSSPGASVHALPGLRRAAGIFLQVIRPDWHRIGMRDYSCSVVIPARNEAGTIEATVRRVPEMGKGTEIIVIEGHSSDGTWEVLQEFAASNHSRKLTILKQQSSNGKGGAVREALRRARGDLLFILDADLTVRPEDLQRFYDAARSGVGEFINGVRSVYSLEPGAMPMVNRMANRLFSIAFSLLLGQRVRDTLCGTKVFFREDYIAMTRSAGRLNELDPFGDFSLLLGAAKLRLRVVDLPIQYQRRTYGRSNIRRWRDGWQLVRVLAAGAGWLRAGRQESGRFERNLRLPLADPPENGASVQFPRKSAFSDFSKPVPSA